MDDGNLDVTRIGELMKDNVAVVAHHEADTNEANDDEDVSSEPSVIMTYDCLTRPTDGILYKQFLDTCHNVKQETNLLIGREQEITSCISILSRPTKNNPLLIGESGVGKILVIKELSEHTISENVFPLHTKSTTIHGTASLTSYIEKYMTIASYPHITIYVDANGQYQLQVRPS
ncbi:unnamed protein product [Adineta steineri]|uniref:Uncharacterized protein n=1 Tax=Adineta steineri TaxID=433720 RepID=A0A813YWX3_9BILA|nr:unnamed protein product [Adineta steineri]CAF3589442.1 unnamed protein product [Adineta steineri]